MSVLEPVTRLETPPPTVVPDQRDDAGPTGVAVIDHVRSHGIKCYWDFTECRWECSPD